jgi:threonine dehydratase
VGAFKVRGGVNLACTLSDDEKARGLISASTGNHGQSVAFGARLVGTRAYVVVPQGANPGKVAAMRGLGAEVIFHGEKFDAAFAHAEQLARERGLRFVHSANEPHLIAGVGTATLEILEAEPRIDTLIVPVGLGSGASGAAIVAKAINPSIRLIAVQAAAAPAVYESWRSGQIESRPNLTFAEGLSTGRAAELTLSILRTHLDDFVLVDEDEIARGMVAWIEHAHTLAESASGAVLAAAHRLREPLHGRHVALMLSGGNTSLEHLQRALGVPKPS